MTILNLNDVSDTSYFSDINDTNLFFLCVYGSSGLFY